MQGNPKNSRGEEWAERSKNPTVFQPFFELSMSFMVNAFRVLIRQFPLAAWREATNPQSRAEAQSAHGAQEAGKGHNGAKNRKTPSVSQLFSELFVPLYDTQGPSIGFSSSPLRPCVSARAGVPGWLLHSPPCCPQER